jgi:hypothetical protein
MSKVLVDKAVLQQALHVATAAAYPVALIATLHAALERLAQEPLSNEELDRLWREPMSADCEHREYARAVEAAHGIKENT